MVNTGLETYREVNINQPIGLLEKLYLQFAHQLMMSNKSSDVMAIMTEPILDFSEIGQVPLERWHIYLIQYIARLVEKKPYCGGAQP